MLLMQLQASLGMCLQDSHTETGPGTSCPLRRKRSQESKTRENEDLWDSRPGKDPGEHLVYPAHFANGETEAPKGGVGLVQCHMVS